jgi:hypothetical protein
MLETFSHGGLWMHIISLFGIVFYVLLVIQFVKGKEADLIPVLVGLLAALVLTGPLGTAVGLHQAGYAVEAKVQADLAASAMAKAFGVANITTAYSLLLAVPGSIALGIASRRSRSA